MGFSLDRRPGWKTVLRFKSKNTYPVLLEFNRSHFPGRVFHGPQSWPWWRWISVAYFNLDHPSGEVAITYRRIWIYTRRGALCIDLSVAERGTL